MILKRICADSPNAFWDGKKHTVDLPHEKDIDEKNIPTKARPIQMNHDLENHCKQEIQTLLDKINQKKQIPGAATFL